jgi:hypothetical protein
MCFIRWFIPSLNSLSIFFTFIMVVNLSILSYLLYFRTMRSYIKYVSTAFEQSGIAKRNNVHILETSQAFLFVASTPQLFWSGTVIYIYCTSWKKMHFWVLDFKTLIETLAHHISACAVLALTSWISRCVSMCLYP